MKRKIFRSICICSLVGISVCITAFFIFSYGYVKNEIINRLSDIRVTIIDINGDVILDNKNDISGMENHADRPEIIQAFEKGNGSSTRFSSTQKEQIYYYAIKINENEVLRLSLATRTINEYLTAIIITVVIIFAIVALICVITANRLTKRIVEPLNQINLEEEKIKGYFELTPFINKINTQNSQINEQLYELKKNTNIRKEFSANVSHELKTPLTTILGYAEILESNMAKSEDISEFSSKIRREATRLLLLIEDIIKLSELDEGDFEISKQYLDLCEIADNVISRLEPVAKKKNISVNLHGKLICLSANPQMMDEMLYNLIQNAISYTDGGGRVDVKIFNNKANVEINVIDSGIGIPKEYLDRIFERFFRVDKSHSKQTGGTGLGLSIVKHIVERHSGKLSVESEPGKGSKFIIIL